MWYHLDVGFKFNFLKFTEYLGMNPKYMWYHLDVGFKFNF